MLIQIDELLNQLFFLLSIPLAFSLTNKFTTIFDLLVQ